MKDHKLSIVMGVLFLIVLAAWLGSYFLIAGLFGTPKSPGTAGDLFGAVGSLFAGLAFVGVLWAILLQRKSLQMQHDDLKATLDEMKQAREAHEESADTLKAQVEVQRLQTRAQILTSFVESKITTSSEVTRKSYAKAFHDVELSDPDMIKGILQELKDINSILRAKAEKAPPEP